MLLAFMLIFETENRIKLCPHSIGEINHPTSFLFKKPITSWSWMLLEKNRLKFSLRHGPCQQAYLRNWRRIQYFGWATGLAVIAKQSVMFFLELDHDTIAISYHVFWIRPKLNARHRRKKCTAKYFELAASRTLNSRHYSTRSSAS